MRYESGDICIYMIMYLAVIAVMSFQTRYKLEKRRQRLQEGRELTQNVLRKFAKNRLYKHFFPKKQMDHYYCRKKNLSWQVERLGS